MGTARSGVGFVFAEGPSGESWYGSHGHRGHMDHVGCQFAVVRQGIHQAGSPGIELLVLSPVCLCLNSVAFTCAGRAKRGSFTGPVPDLPRGSGPRG